MSFFVVMGGGGGACFCCVSSSAWFLLLVVALFLWARHGDSFPKMRVADWLCSAALAWWRLGLGSINFRIRTRSPEISKNSPETQKHRKIEICKKTLEKIIERSPIFWRPLIEIEKYLTKEWKILIRGGSGNPIELPTS